MSETPMPIQTECPCCGREVVLAKQENLKASWCTPSDRRVSSTIAQMAAQGKYFYHHCNQERLVLYWACNECIRSRRALVADFRKQKWCRCEPYLAYFDETKTCVDCGALFVFTKEEQQHWYETLRFWVWSRPIRCKDCSAKRKSGHAK